MNNPNTDFDTPWKDVLEIYFEDFVSFFFPQAHAGIDWNQGFEFLDKELQQVVRDAELGKRLVDKLVKIYRLAGEETWVLIHIEIHKEAQTCIEALMSPSQIGAKLCVHAITIEKVNQQSYIYKTESTIIRIFSPFPDKISTLCGHIMNQNAGTILEGYTDLSFKSDCVLYTSQLIIYSPFKPTIEETIQPLLSTPDLSMEIENLLSVMNLVP